LYVVDDGAGPRGGVIQGGWQLSIQTAPKIAPIANQQTPEDTQVRVTVTIGDSQPGVPLTVTATSFSQTLVSDTNIVISGTGATRTLTIQPNLNAFGTNTIRVTVSDTLGNTDSEDFLLAVVAVDDPPSFSHIPDQTTKAAVAVGTS